MPTTLILGMSHVRALSDARTEAEARSVQAINLRDHPKAFDRKGSRFLGAEAMPEAPALVCLTLAGNFHNIFCLMENAAKFRLGDPDLVVTILAATILSVLHKLEHLVDLL